MLNFINKISFLILVIFLSLSLSGCKEVHHYKKENVVSVYYHEKNRYSVIVNESNELKSVSFPYGLKVKVFTDVKPDESMWYEINYYRSDFDGIKKDKNPYLHIHVRNHKDLSGASWNHGKFGTGKTVKVAE